jgi:hypothetical protein
LEHTTAEEYIGNVRQNEQYSDKDIYFFPTLEHFHIIVLKTVKNNRKNQFKKRPLVFREAVCSRTPFTRPKVFSLPRIVSNDEGGMRRVPPEALRRVSIDSKVSKS